MSSHTPFNNKSINIAVIDDEKEICDFFEQLLEDKKYNVITFQSSIQAQQYIKNHDFDLIITDLIMPELNGFEILKEVRQNTPLTEVIVITGHASINTAVEAMNYGAYSYITKPFIIEEVQTQIEKAIEKRLLTLENRRLLENLTKTNQELQKKIDELEQANRQLTETKEELIETERLAAIGQVVVSIDHELNNSLMAILSGTRLLLNTSEMLSSKDKETLKLIQNEVLSMQKVIVRLRQMKRTVTTEYIDGIKMINMDQSRYSPKERKTKKA